MLTGNDVLERYRAEMLPEFIGLSLGHVNDRGHYGNCPIHVACVRNNFAEAEALVAIGADVNAIGEHGYRPIHEAVICGATEIVKLLIDSGAGKNYENDYGESPALLAAQCGLKEMSELLAHY